MRELVLRLRAFGARHEFLSAALFFTVLACAWSWPMFKGDQLTQDYVLYRSVPWKAERPAALRVTPRTTDWDIATQHYAFFRVARDDVHHGALPFWNPYIFGGLTMVGDMQTAVLSPFTWLGWMLGAGFAWGLLATLKLVVAGFGTYVLARQLRLSRGGGLVAGAVFSLSAPIMVWLQWPLGTVFMLLPWLMWAVDRVYREPTVTRAAALAVVLALNVVAGHPESAIINAAVAGLYVLVLAAFDSRKRTRRERARGLAGWVGGYAAGVLLAAPAILPFLAAARDSISTTTHIQAGGHLEWWTAITYALPNIFGIHQLTGINRTITYSSLCLYFGAAALFLAVVGGWSFRRTAAARALIAVAIVCALVLFGAPPFGAVFRDVWPFKVFVVLRLYVPLALIGALGAGAAVTALSSRPLPLRSIFAFVGAFGAAVAVAALGARGLGIVGASSGLDVLTRSSVLQAVGRFALFAVLAVVCLWALGRLRRSLAIALVLAVCIADLSLLQDYNVWLGSSLAHARTPGSIAFLTRQRGPFRVSPWAPGDIRDVLPPNTTAPFGVETPTGYYYPESKRWAFLTYRVFRGRHIADELISDPVPRSASLAGLRAFNTRYYLTPPGAPPPSRGFQAIYRARDAIVWLDRQALPRAFVVGSTRPMDDAAVLDALAAGRFDARATALVPPSTRPVRVPDEAKTSPRFRRADAVEVGRDRARVRVSVPSGPAGWLVLANGYTKQWRAKVDGRRVRVRPTNYAAMGVPVGAGAHNVEFYVDESPFWKGVGLFFLTAVLLALAVLGDRRRRTTGAGWFGRL